MWHVLTEQGGCDWLPHWLPRGTALCHQCARWSRWLPCETYALAMPRRQLGCWPLCRAVLPWEHCCQSSPWSIQGKPGLTGARCEVVQFGGRTRQQTYQGPDQGPGESEGPRESGLRYLPKDLMATPPVRPQVEGLHWIRAEGTGEVPQQWLLGC